MEFPSSSSSAEPSTSVSTSLQNCYFPRQDPPGKQKKHSSFMSLVIESISTERDRLATRMSVVKPKDKEDDSTAPEKNIEQDWEKLRLEIEAMIETTIQLNETFRNGKTEEQFLYALKRTTEIFIRREELFSIIIECSPSYERRDTLILLHKLRDIDDKDPIGTAMNVMDVEMVLTKRQRPSIVRNVGCLMEPGTFPTDAERLLMAFRMSFCEMIALNSPNNNEQTKSRPS